MRDSDKPGDTDPEAESAAEFEARTFFSSYYRATARGQIVDSMTIGTVSEPEARFHYNASENSIIRCLTKFAPIGNQPPGVWRFAQARRAWHVLDVGSGTGHWLDFYLDVYLVKAITAVEFVPQMAEFLRTKYAGRPEVTVLRADVANDPLPDQQFDIVNAIGVMFHIVDDQLWRQTVVRLLAALKPDGLMLIGGDFGAETRNVQFHRTDHFESWSEHDSTKAPTQLVNKRVRSLAEWTRLAGELGAVVAEVIRSDTASGIRTPENDLLVLRRAPAGG
jgi:SAM-dependent methyltransferase